jgi:transcription initiation factor TFIIIB Brf1 subunit/transcription initiation factor TFIIB
MPIIHKMKCPECNHITIREQYAMYNITCEKCGCTIDDKGNILVCGDNDERKKSESVQD